MSLPSPRRVESDHEADRGGVVRIIGDSIAPVLRPTVLVSARACSYDRYVCTIVKERDAMGQGEIRSYVANARSTDTFGRVLCNIRDHHFIIDGPVQNGCPGEEVTPAEVFLVAVASCGVELLQGIARDQQVPLDGVKVEISGALDRGNPVRRDLSVFNWVKLGFQLSGVSQSQADDLVERFRGR